MGSNISSECDQGCKVRQILSHLHLRNDLSYEVGFFCMWLAMHKYIYMIQSIRMGVARHSWECK